MENKKKLLKTKKKLEDAVVDEDNTDCGVVTGVHPSERGQPLDTNLSSDARTVATDFDSKVKAKTTRKRKQSSGYEEDVIDGFLIVSYSTVQELEADGPIRPGAAVGKVGKLREKRKGRGPGKKAKKVDVAKATGIKLESDVVDGISQQKRKKKTLLATEGDDDATALVSSPADAVREPGRVSNDVTSKLVTFDGAHTVAMPMKEMVCTKIASEVDKDATENKKKSLSDFSIKAIQNFTGSTPFDVASSPISSPMSVKGPATLSGVTARHLSGSPMTLSFQKALSRGESFNDLMTVDRASAMGARGAPITGGLSRKSESIFVDGSTGRNGGRILQISETSNIRLAVSSVNNQSSVILANAASGALSRDSTRFFGGNAGETHSKSSVDSDSSKSRPETHQHQHQHIHQHQHQHFHPPYPTPAAPAAHAHSNLAPVTRLGAQYNPLYYGGIPLIPIAQNQPHRAHAIPAPRAEKFPVLKPDQEKATRAGFHAFQAVQSRGHGGYHDSSYYGHPYRSSRSPTNSSRPLHTGPGLPPSLVRNSSEKDLPFTNARSFAPVYRKTETSVDSSASHLPFGGLGSAFSGSPTREQQSLQSRVSPSRFAYNAIREYDRARTNDPPLQFARPPAGYRLEAESHSESERHSRFTASLLEKEQHDGGGMRKFRSATVDAHERRSPSHLASDYFSSLHKANARNSLRLPTGSSASLLKTFEPRYVDAAESLVPGRSRINPRSYSPVRRQPYPTMPASRQNALACLGMQNHRYTGHQT